MSVALIRPVPNAFEAATVMLNAQRDEHESCFDMIRVGLWAILLGLLIPILLLAIVVLYAFWPVTLTAAVMGFICWAAKPFREGWEKGKRKRCERLGRL